MKVDLAIKHSPGNWEFMFLALSWTVAQRKAKELEKQGAHVGLFRNTPTLGKLIYQTQDCVEHFRNGPDTAF